MKKCYSIFLEKPIDFKILADLFVNFFSIPKDKFMILKGSIVDKLYENENFFDNINDSINICETFILDGDFKFKVELGLEAENLPSEINFAMDLSKITLMRCLIGSNEINPYHWILIEPNGISKEVFVDPNSLDRDNQIILT